MKLKEVIVDLNKDQQLEVLTLIQVMSGQESPVDESVFSSIEVTGFIDALRVFVKKCLELTPKMNSYQLAICLSQLQLAKELKKLIQDHIRQENALRQDLLGSINTIAKEFGI